MPRIRGRPRLGRTALAIVTATMLTVGLGVATQAGALARDHDADYKGPVPACTRSHGEAAEHNPHCQNGAYAQNGDQDDQGHQGNQGNQGHQGDNGNHGDQGDHGNHGHH